MSDRAAVLINMLQKQCCRLFCCASLLLPPRHRKLKSRKFASTGKCHHNDFGCQSHLSTPASLAKFFYAVIDASGKTA